MLSTQQQQQQQAHQDQIATFMSDAASSAAFGTGTSKGPSYVCSIFPIEMRSDQPHLSMIPNGQYDENSLKGTRAAEKYVLSNRTIYILPAPAKGSYTVRPIYDTAQMIQNIINPEDSTIGMIPAPIKARTAAESLVDLWTAHTIGATAGRKIGIGLIDGPKPSALELDSLTRSQEALFSHLINEADGFDHQSQRNKITNLHKMAVEWMGVTNRAWAKGLSHHEVKDCIACGYTIRALATVCENCNSNLIAQLQAAADWMTDAELALKDPHCYDIVKRLKERTMAATVQKIQAGKAKDASPTQ